ncbi:MAG: glycosyltransferase family 4 protein [Candidatus Omnitrophica bacterium]|nr:glycosyltransferase family 4 protein [Candidatus Omnitrophota bacterium]
MNILHLVPALEAGGVETGTVDLALSLKKSGETVIVVSSGGKLVRDLENNGISHIKLPINRKSLFTLFLIPRIISLIKINRIDVVHASSRVPAWVGFFACKCTNIPFVTSCHGFYSKNIFSYIMGRGDRVMVISKAIEKRMTEGFRVPARKIRLVYRGLDLTKYSYCADKYENSAKNAYVVINIGRLTPVKGQYEFIKAMKRVTDKVKNTEAWIAGNPERNNKSYLHKLKNLAEKLGIEGSIKFLGHRDDVYDLLKKADCLVLSTVIPEGFGRVLIEAGAAGTACCASNTGGIKEIIEDNVTGLLFPPGDEAGMADTIIKMLGNPRLCGQYAKNLRKRVEEYFNLEQMAQKTLAVYKEVAKNNV